MVVPLLAGASFAISSVYSAGRALDNYRYWDAYYRSTGHRPKYPFRSGSMDWMNGAPMIVGGFGRMRNLSRPRQTTIYHYGNYYARRR